MHHGVIILDEGTGNSLKLSTAVAPVSFLKLGLAAPEVSLPFNSERRRTTNARRRRIAGTDRIGGSPWGCPNVPHAEPMSPGNHICRIMSISAIDIALLHPSSTPKTSRWITWIKSQRSHLVGRLTLLRPFEAGSRSLVRAIPPEGASELATPKGP